MGIMLPVSLLIQLDVYNIKVKVRNVNSKNVLKKHTFTLFNCVIPSVTTTTSFETPLYEKKTKITLVELRYYMCLKDYTVLIYPFLH